MTEIHKLYRNLMANTMEVRKMIESCSTIMWIKKSNTVVFFKHEGEIGEAENIDNMNIRTVAQSLGKRYDEVR